MRQSRRAGWRTLLRQALACAPVFLCLVAPPSFAGSLLPANFFDRMPDPGQGRIGIEADYLSQDANGVATATGQVEITYAGYRGTADKLIYDGRKRDVFLIGNVVMRDPQGTEYASDRVEITGNMRKAVLQSLVMVTEDGAIVTATYVDRIRGESALLENGTYSPCGTCIDAKGRRIGWRVRTDSILQKEADEVVELENATLEVLGIPIAWVPWIRLPDPTQNRSNGFSMPSYDYSDKTGHKVTFPYFLAAADDIDLIFEPSLMSRQVGLMSVTLNQRFGDKADYSVTASGTYAVDRTAFTGTPGDREWRGALQASANFTPSKEWKFGAAYSILSDRAYLRDYLLDTKQSGTNQVFATYLTPESFADVRVQEFVLLGDAFQVNQDVQGMNLPRVEARHVQELGGDLGRIEASGNLQYVRRVSDSTSTVNGVTYIEGYAENKIHGTGELAWQKQLDTPIGVLFTPYLGLRIDAANYDGSSALLPGAQQLFAATPIAALDVRYPFVGYAQGSTHIIEPIVQIVYRGSSTTNLGVTNDNAQSFVFDDTNLFSYNRFSGTDRQETGLRANLGYHYLAEFDDGSYLDFVHGQSYQLAGANAFSIFDAAQTGTDSGMAGGISDQVVGLTAGFNQHFKVGGKARFNLSTGLQRAAIAASVDYERWQIGVDYSYRVASTALGALSDQQDIGASLQIPLDDYWRVNAAAGYNITSASLIDSSIGLTYDDGYFESSLKFTSSGADPFNPASQSITWSFLLKTPGGEAYGLSND